MNKKREKVRCNNCNSIMERVNLKMSGYVGIYKYAYRCPNDCKEIKLTNREKEDET